MAALLKVGAKGPDVRNLQQLLNNQGFKVEVDGDFGDNTVKAVKQFQRQNKLLDDGVVGDHTWSVLKTPTAILGALTEEDYQWAATFLGDDVPSVKAVKQVEAPNGGFLPDGRTTILYERHIMYRRLKENGIDPEQYTTQFPNLVNVKAGGYSGNAGEYTRLTSAKAIDETSALESCSWGAYQIMGFQWNLLRYPNVQAFVADMQVSERKQLEAFAHFIKSQPALLKAIRSDDWPMFARYYNGANYAINKYDEKLKAAFTSFSAKV